MNSNSNRGLWEGKRVFDITYVFGGPNYSYPKFAPDGKHIAYVVSNNGESNVFVRELNSGEEWQLTADLSISAGPAYGGGVLCWKGTDSLIVISKGTPYEVSIYGGIPKQLPSYGKSFAPVARDGKVVMSVELESSMALSLLEDGWPVKLPLAADFIYDPQINMNGDICIHTWNFPNMSWNASKIVLLRAASNYESVVVAGNDSNIACSQPRFSPDGEHLAFLCDATGWLNLWIADADGTNARVLVQEDAEHAYSTWATGEVNYQWTGDSQAIIFTRHQKGFMSLAKVDIATGNVSHLPIPDGYYSHLSADTHTNCIVYMYSNYKIKNQLQLLELGDTVKMSVLGNSGIRFPELDLAQPIEHTIPLENGQVTHGHLYAVPDTKAEITNAPTIIIIHGGPTGMAMNRFKPNYPYFASRGWVVFALNHRGSIGYGRAYRESLNGNWGLYDVEDTIAAYNYLVEQGITDPKKCVIMGGSAGGFTSLMTLAMHPGMMAAGVNMYGVSDLFSLSEETHYLESQYDTTLIGPLPEAAEQFYRRSPVYLADKIVDPLITLQGADDPVVVKDQSDRIFAAVQGVKEYKVYEGEGHGFSKKATLIDMYKRIDNFLRKNVLYTCPKDL